MVAHTFNPVFGSHTPLIPALGRLRQEGIWLDGKTKVKQEEAELQTFSLRIHRNRSMPLFVLRIL